MSFLRRGAMVLALVSTISGSAGAAQRGQDQKTPDQRAQGQSGPEEKPDGATVANAVLEIDYTNENLRPSHWVMTIARDGSGHFRSERGSLPPDPAMGLEAGDIDRDIHVKPEFAVRAFEAVHQRHYFEAGCESHMQVAFQGWKKLTYTGPDGSGSCTYNFSKSKEIQALGDSLVAVATGVMEGARLESLLVHDRLGLDKEMEFLMEATGDGRVQQICAIHEILERLAQDPQVMERVRKRAKVLLARADG